MAVALFLRIAIAVARAVAQLHARGLVHKNIKPANIPVDAVPRSFRWRTILGRSFTFMGSPTPCRTTQEMVGYWSTMRVNKSQLMSAGYTLGLDFEPSCPSYVLSNCQVLALTARKH